MGGGVLCQFYLLSSVLFIHRHSTRVIRLSEFSHIGWLFTLCSFFENYRNSPIHNWGIYLLQLHLQVMFYF
jgi:hypothetical protein